MSVLVARRGAESAEIASVFQCVPIDRLHLRASYEEALAAWGAARSESWSAVLGWRSRPWGDLVNDSRADASARASLVRVLGELARASDELAIWYAGFPEDVPAVSSPEEFEAVVSEQLAAGELEPAARWRAHR